MRKLLLCLALAGCTNKAELAAKDKEIGELRAQVAAVTEQMMKATTKAAEAEVALEKEQGAREAARDEAIERALKANIGLTEHFLGRHIVDDSGAILDMPRTLRDLRAWAFRTYGRDEVVRRMLFQVYGTEAGLAIYAAGPKMATK